MYVCMYSGFHLIRLLLIRLQVVATLSQPVYNVVKRWQRQLTEVRLSEIHCMYVCMYVYMYVIYSVRSP